MRLDLTVKQYKEQIWCSDYRYFITRKTNTNSSLSLPCGVEVFYKESSPIFFIGRSDAPKFDIIWSENENLIDRFIPEILMLKVRSKWVRPLLNRKMAVFSTF